MNAEVEDPDVANGTVPAAGVDVAETSGEAETETDEGAGAIVDVDVNVETPGS